MKRYIFAKTLCIALGLGFALQGAQAQESSVEIVTNYNPNILSAEKILAPTSIEDDPTIQPFISYEVQPSLWQIALNAHNFLPAKASYWDYSSYKCLFAKAAVGYPFGSELRAHYTFQTPKLGYIGVGVDHVGDFAQRSFGDVERSIAESYNMQNRANLLGGVFIDRYLLDFAVVYTNDIYNGYAMQAPERRMFNDVGAGLRFGDEFVDLSYLNFEVEAHANLWSHPMSSDDDELSELNYGASATLARDFRGNVIELDLNFDQREMQSLYDYSDMRIGGALGYARKFGFFDLEVGVGYLFDKQDRSDAKHNVMPRMKMMLDLRKVSFAPYIEFNTSLVQNSPSSLFKANPYIDLSAMGGNLSTLGDTTSYNLALGFTGTLASSRVAYHLYVGANFMRDQLFWYVTRDGMFGVTGDNNNRIYMGVAAKFVPAAGLKIDLGFDYHIDNHKSQFEQSEAKMTGNLGIEYARNKWKVYARGELLGARTWSVLPLVEGEPMGTFKMNTCVDLSAGVSYRINRIVEIYVVGENLLNSKIYDFANYYRQGIGGMIGAKIDF